jgi:hypothetical protein
MYVKTIESFLWKISDGGYETLVSVHPQTASFGPGRRFLSFEILKIARYSSGFKIAQALPRTKIYHLWMDTS